MAKSKVSTRRSNRKSTPAKVSKARRELAAQGALPPEPGDPELGAYLEAIVRELHAAEDVALTVAGALQNENTTESQAAAETLRRYCANELTEQIGKLERAIEGTCMVGSQLIVNSNRIGSKATPAGAQS